MGVQWKGAKAKEEHINKRVRNEMLTMEYKITFKRTHYVLASAEIYNTKKPFDALADECRNVHAYNSVRRNMQLAWRNVTLCTHTAFSAAYKL